MTMTRLATTSTISIVMTAVSYTHLDVYKRQVYDLYVGSAQGRHRKSYGPFGPVQVVVDARQMCIRDSFLGREQHTYNKLCDLS